MSDAPRTHDTTASNCEVRQRGWSGVIAGRTCLTCEDDQERLRWGLDVQPEPVRTDNESSHDIAIREMQARKEFGYQKYNSLLTAGNGRNSIQDAVDEAADLFVYAITERTEREILRAAMEDANTMDVNSETKFTLLHAAVSRYLGKQ